ncbi:MAG: thioredoxin [Gammaproteobacteria bacterium]|nr:MAG: thioredoxin [Gammaproteobacteria bacterium]
MFKHLIKFIFLHLLMVVTPTASALADDPLIFDDTPLSEALDSPSWFKLSFLDLQDSLNEAIAAKKAGMIVYFGRKDCAYCKAQLEVNWGSRDIVDYTRKHFDVIGIDVSGQRTVTDFNGKTYTEKDYSALTRTNFTPTLHFYNTAGQLVLNLRGYRPPYQFRAALEYVADAHYRREAFRDYLARAESALGFGLDEMNEHDAFLPPPFNLDRSKQASSTPLVVFFEHPRCHACDVLHAGPLSEPELNASIYNLEAVQIDTTSDTPVITPRGIKTTARQWARDLDLSFAPTLVFFDENGNEIIRIDSVVRLYRLNNVLLYVLSKGYKKYPTFQIWREQTRR